MSTSLSEAESLEVVRLTGAVLEGHFVLTSGLHSGHFVSKDLVGTLPAKLERLAATIASAFIDSGVEVVAAPAMGAIKLGDRVAPNLGDDVISVYAEQAKDGSFFFGRGFDQFIREGTRVIVVEDIITTGKTTRAVIAAVEKLGGEVVGIGLLWNRSQEEFGVTLFACVSQNFPNYTKEECPLCRRRVPINTKANKHGVEFLGEYGEDPTEWPANRSN